MAASEQNETFRVRAERLWKRFAGIEHELRRIMDEDQKYERRNEIIEKINEIFQSEFDNITFEVGGGGEKYELVLSPEGDKVRLFELVCLRRFVTDDILKSWDITVGRTGSKRFALRLGEQSVSGDDVRVWTERSDDERKISVSVYCEKLLPLLSENRSQAEWLLYTIADCTLGEIVNMRYIDRFDIIREPISGASVSLCELSGVMNEMGFDFSNDSVKYLDNSFFGYHMGKPNEDPNAEPRLDVIAGSSNCTELLNGYFGGDSYYADMLRADGAAAGFLCYSLDAFTGEDRNDKIFDFRERLENALLENAGEDAVTLIGGATGIYRGYVDFIAWDLPAVLDAAREFFKGSETARAYFRSFRRDGEATEL